MKPIIPRSQVKNLAILSRTVNYIDFPVMAEYIKGAKKVVDDSSLMTYRGHTVLQTLIRCRFSPAHTTAQRYIYTGCASGSVYGK